MEMSAMISEKTLKDCTAVRIMPSEVSEHSSYTAYFAIFMNRSRAGRGLSIRLTR